jgi:hypothetical protein
MFAMVRPLVRQSWNLKDLKDRRHEDEKCVQQTIPTLRTFADFMFFMFQALAMPPCINATPAGQSWNLKDLKD